MACYLAVGLLGWGPVLPVARAPALVRARPPVSLLRAPQIWTHNASAVSSVRTFVNMDLKKYDPVGNSPSERRRLKRAFQLRTQQALSTLVRVALPTIFATVRHSGGKSCKL